MSSESLLWFLGLAGKWVRQASLSCLHKGKERRNQWAVFTGYTADCNTARYVTHSQAVKTDELLGRAQPGQPLAKSRQRQQWHTGQEQLLATGSSLRRSKKWAKKFQKYSEASVKRTRGRNAWFLSFRVIFTKTDTWDTKTPWILSVLNIKKTCTHVRSTQMGPLHNLFLQESGLSVYTSLWSFLLGSKENRVQQGSYMTLTFLILLNSPKPKTIQHKIKESNKFLHSRIWN